MPKQNRLTQVLLALLCIILLWSGLTAAERIRRLENQVVSLQQSLYRYDFYHELQTLRQSLKEEIGKGASIVTSTKTLVAFNDGTFDVRMTVVPKAIQDGEAVYLSLGGERIQATTSDGMAYSASFSLSPTESVQPHLAIESATGRRQERLTEVNFRNYLSLAVSSRMEHESNTLDIEIFPLQEESREVFSSHNSVELVLYDGKGGNLGRIPFVAGMSGFPYEDEHLGLPGSQAYRYHLVIPDRYYEQGSFSASVVVALGEVVLSADEVYAYTYEGHITESIGGGEFRITFGE